MDNNNSERFFAEVAKTYAENEGAALYDDFVETEAKTRMPSTAGLDRKIKNKLINRKINKFTRRALPLAAAFVVAILLYNNAGDAPQESGPDTMYYLQSNVELVSALLPAGYWVTDIDYDNAAAIMEIENEAANHIVLAIEEYDDFKKEGFSVIFVNGEEVYGMVKNDYSILRYRKYDMLYTFTCMYDYIDMVDIIRCI